MILTIYFLCLTLFTLASCEAAVDSMHFFQLNSYRFDTHTKWMRTNFSKYLPRFTLAAVILIMAMIPFKIEIKLSVCAVLFAAAVLCERPKKAKKPLVYTNRVKRMLITETVLLSAAIGCTAPFLNNSHESIALFILACLYAVIPFFCLIANLVNKPVELSINRYYINDAKRILRSCPDLNIIGITGSYGKTSVKYYLSTLLRAKYNVLMTPESYNTPMGVVKTVRGSLKATHEIFVCEMGAKWVGDIKELCDIVHPAHGVITSVGPQHLESFRTLDAVKSTKFELADALPESGMLFLNGDDINIKDYGCKRPAITYAIDNADADYTAFGISVGEKGTSFSVKAPNGETESFKTKLIGRHNVLNIVGAIAISHKMGIPLSELRGQVRKLEGVPHRLELSQKNGVTIIDDAYNSNPSGAKAALEALSLFDGYKILVTPGMVELGEREEELNREFGKNAAEICDYAVLVGKHRAVPIKAGLTDKGFAEEKIFVADTINEALAHVYALKSGGQKKIILLENDLPDNY